MLACRDRWARRAATGASRTSQRRGSAPNTPAREGLQRWAVALRAAARRATNPVRRSGEECAVARRAKRATPAAPSTGSRAATRLDVDAWPARPPGATPSERTVAGGVTPSCATLLAVESRIRPASDRDAGRARMSISCSAATALSHSRSGGPVGAGGMVSALAGSASARMTRSKSAGSVTSRKRACAEVTATCAAPHAGRRRTIPRAHRRSVPPPRRSAPPRRRRTARPRDDGHGAGTRSRAERGARSPPPARRCSSVDALTKARIPTNHSGIELAS